MSSEDSRDYKLSLPKSMKPLLHFMTASSLIYAVFDPFLYDQMPGLLTSLSPSIRAPKGT